MYDPSLPLTTLSHQPSYTAGVSGTMRCTQRSAWMPSAGSRWGNSPTAEAGANSRTSNSCSRRMGSKPRREKAQVASSSTGTIATSSGLPSYFMALNLISCSVFLWRFFAALSRSRRACLINWPRRLRSAAARPSHS